MEAPAHGVATGPGKEFLRAGALALASHLAASAAQGPAHREGVPVMSPSCANGTPFPGSPCPRRRTDPVGRSPVTGDAAQELLKDAVLKKYELKVEDEDIRVAGRSLAAAQLHSLDRKSVV